MSDPGGPLPDPDRPRRPVRLDAVSALSILGVLTVLAASAAALAATPPRPVPTWALASGVVYRIEVLLAVLAGLYVAAAVLYSSLHDRLVVRLSAAGASVEFAWAEDTGGIQDVSSAHADLVAVVDDLASRLDEHDRRLGEDH